MAMTSGSSLEFLARRRPEDSGSARASAHVPETAQHPGRVLVPGRQLDSSETDSLETASDHLAFQLFTRPPIASRRPSDPALLGTQHGTAEVLPDAVRGRLERRMGRPFGDVRVHTDSRAADLASRYAARAFTIGSDVVFGAGQYRPGTVVGDALIAHELAHVAQQNSARTFASDPGSNEAALELDANRAASGALEFTSDGMSRLAAAHATPIPRGASGLRLQRCQSCSPAEQSLLDKLQDVSDVESLGAKLGELDNSQLAEIRGQTTAESLLGKAVRWESAMRKLQWDAVAVLHQGDAQGFYKVYVSKLVDAIMAGKTSLHVDGTDREFAQWVKEQLGKLGEGAVGFRLLVELIATKQNVNLKRTAGENENQRVMTEENPEAGRYVTTDNDGKLLPKSQQHVGASTGSNITLNPSAADNRDVIGGTAAAPTLIPMDPTIMLGHELIHALHNARGENIAPSLMGSLGKALGITNNLVRDPGTGEAVNAEELRTITGQTSFQAPVVGVTGKVDWALDYNLGTGITENQLRAERGIEPRLSHFGTTRAYSVAVAKGETLEQMISRYSMSDHSAIPVETLAAIRASFIDFNPMFQDPRAILPVDYTLPFPHGDYIATKLGLIFHKPDLAENAKKLRVRGAK